MLVPSGKTPRTRMVPTPVRLIFHLWYPSPQQRCYKLDQHNDSVTFLVWGWKILISICRTTVTATSVRISHAVFFGDPPELHVIMSERCFWSKSGVSFPLLFTHLTCHVFLPFCIHLHFRMYIFLALNVHSAGPVSITVLFLLHIPYLASPDV